MIPTTEVIRYQVEDGQEEAFQAAYRQAGILLERSPDCDGFQVLRGVEEPRRFLVLIRWRSVERHLEGFRKSADFAAFFALVKPFFGAIEEMKHYQTDPAE
ncbi:MAG: antibiotic biosynthesis monooxygenase [Cytophagales bacterium]|nr:antibiotic biosynthesis monooxygenase [Armatimonadota bacterium]